MLTPRVLWQEQGTEVRLEKYNTENENKEKESKRYVSHAHNFEFNIFPSTQNISVDASYTFFSDILKAFRQMLELFGWYTTKDSVYQNFH